MAMTAGRTNFANGVLDISLLSCSKVPALSEEREYEKLRLAPLICHSGGFLGLVERVLSVSVLHQLVTVTDAHLQLRLGRLGLGDLRGNAGDPTLPRLAFSVQKKEPRPKRAWLQRRIDTEACGCKNKQTLIAPLHRDN